MQCILYFKNEFLLKRHILETKKNTLVTIKSWLEIKCIHMCTIQ